MRNYFLSEKIIIYFLVLFFFSCKDENGTNNISGLLAGTWQLSTVQVDELDMDLSTYPGYIRFQANQVYISYDEIRQEFVRGGWSYDEGMLNISVDLPAAYYISQVDADDLLLKQLNFKTDGELSITIKHYLRTDDSKIPDNQ